MMTRAEARNIGLKRFYSGKECPRGHNDERLVSNGTCVSCSKERLSEWNKINAKKRREDSIDANCNRPITLRAEAKEIGLRRYYTGKKCINGHLDERRTSDGKCMQCVKIKNNKRRNKGKEYMKIQIKKWKSLNKHKVKAYNHNRRSSFGTLTSDQINKCLINQNERCFYCGVDISKVYHVDHVVPLSSGGWNIICNIQCACPTCNLRKGTKSKQEFMEIIKNENEL